MAEALPGGPHREGGFPSPDWVHSQGTSVSGGGRRPGFKTPWKAALKHVAGFLAQGPPYLGASVELSFRHGCLLRLPYL